MIDIEIVEIIATRIMNGGRNPKTGNIYVIEDITNQDYKVAVEEFISNIAT